MQCGRIASQQLACAFLRAGVSPQTRNSVRNLTSSVGTRTRTQTCRTSSAVVGDEQRRFVNKGTLFFRPHIDLKRVRDNISYIETNTAARKSPGDAKLVAQLYDEYIRQQLAVDSLRQARNVLSKTKVSSSPDSPVSSSSAAAAVSSAAAKRAEGRRIKEELAKLEITLADVRARLDAAASQLPCDTHPDAPIGAESFAKEILLIHGGGAASSTASSLHTFQPKDHVTLAQSLQLADFDAGATIAGSGFVVLKNEGVLLELALVQWALTKLMSAGFQAVAPPDIAHVSLVEGCGFNPRDSVAPLSSSSLLPTPPAGAGSDTSATGGGISPSQVYSITGTPLCLIGTSEIPLAGLHAGQLIEYQPQSATSSTASVTLPAFYAGISHCFRHEAGSGGQASRGLYRLHQFTKVEMFAYVAPDSDPSIHVEQIQEKSLLETLIHKPSTVAGAAAISPSSLTASSSSNQSPHLSGPTAPSPASEAAFARLVDMQIQIVRELGLHARVLDMPTEELGASAYRKVDIEAWMPGRKPVSTSALSSSSSSTAATTTSTTTGGAYGEISSASNCIDYQARRLNIRYRASARDNNKFVHTLNATAVAIPRLIIAILETHQREDGSVGIPACLQPYMGGRTELRRKQ